ncbi:hypothetical protein A8709_01670 [Paenibacillus pectinilyticus]|uniref:Uncharacterized protein n=1 Tax=Paenibacillus pectinilyticus TaxID=512399 RepID=A0A1C1A6I8_9BACL|nr:DUF5345 family protein [Paenibacillus pectinilyticus]OCT16177.1 hypothetical protein A8709_01670 [Paenibacillus pectinilyticus]
MDDESFKRQEPQNKTDANQAVNEKRSAATSDEQALNETQSEEQADEQTARELREGLDLLDAAIHVPTPSAAWFDQHIAVTQSRRRSRLLRDLLILWIGAMLVFYIFYVTVTVQPVAFLSIQAVATLVPLAWLIFRRLVTSHDNNGL